MSRFDLHPEELLDRARRGQASADERARVEQHLMSCEACRFEHALLAQGARDAAPHPGDGARARRIEQAAAAALAARGVLAPSAAPRRRRAGALIAAAVVSSLATAAAAAVLEQPAWIARWLPVASAPASNAAKVRAPRARRAPAPAPAAPATAPVLAPSVVPVPPIAEPLPANAPARSAATTDRRSRSPRDAAALFAAANLARREHATGSAVRLYRELLQSHPRSEEAAVAHVVLGRLLLDRAGDARGALREFDAYLTRSELTALREDALIGRALALGRLGRAQKEHAAWTALLAAFPGSGYAERARARLLELRCAVESC